MIIALEHRLGGAAFLAAGAAQAQRSSPWGSAPALAPAAFPFPATARRWAAGSSDELGPYGGRLPRSC